MIKYIKQYIHDSPHSQQLHTYLLTYLLSNNEISSKAMQPHHASLWTGTVCIQDYIPGSSQAARVTIMHHLTAILNKILNAILDARHQDSKAVVVTKIRYVRFMINQSSCARQLRVKKLQNPKCITCATKWLFHHENKMSIIIMDNTSVLIKDIT